MSTVDKLNKVLETKLAIKEAIESKGQTVGDVFADYPAAIQNIEGGGGSGTFVVPGGMRFAYSKIDKFPENWDWSEFEKETDLSYSFDDCTKLIDVPKMNLTPSNLSNCFNKCNKLKEIDLSKWDTSNVTKMDNMFNECSELANIKFGVFDTSKNTTFRYMFNGTILKSIPELNASANTDTYSTYNSPIKCSRLRNFGGLKGINKTWYIDQAYSLSYDSLVNIIKGLADGVSGQTLYMLRDQVNQLSDEDIAIATNKGWSISPAKTITETVVVTDLSQVSSSTSIITPRTYDFSQYSGSWKGGSYTSALKCTPYVFEADLSSTTNASYMFYGKTYTYYVDLKNTQNITDMSYMFYNCSYITNVPLLDTSNVTNMNHMFYNNRALESVTMVGGVDKLTNTNYLFHNVADNGTFYYDSRYDYSKVIAELPETWTAVPITV